MHSVAEGLGFLRTKSALVKGSAHRLALPLLSSCSGHLQIAVGKTCLKKKKSSKGCVAL